MDKRRCREKRPRLTRSEVLDSEKRRLSFAHRPRRAKSRSDGRTQAVLAWQGERLLRGLQPCPHGKLKSKCADCKPCPHGKRKDRCADCNPCPHGRLKRSCADCSPCPRGKLKRYCATCK